MSRRCVCGAAQSTKGSVCVGGGDVSDDDLVNGGIYYISTNIYKEFAKTEQVVEEDIKL